MIRDWIEDFLLDNIHFLLSQVGLQIHLDILQSLIHKNIKNNILTNSMRNKGMKLMDSLQVISTQLVFAQHGVP